LKKVVKKEVEGGGSRQKRGALTQRGTGTLPDKGLTKKKKAGVDQKLSRK